jgi:hypothetical protein
MVVPISKKHPELVQKIGTDLLGIRILKIVEGESYFLVSPYKA